MNWLIALLILTTPTDVDRWPAFLGAGAIQSSDSKLPLTWSPSENVAWQATLPGHGQSSPVVWGDRVYVTSVEGPEKDTYHTVCLDLASGSEHWRKSLNNTVPVTNSYYVSRAAPTPVVDGERVIAFFESGDCVAYSHDGEELWRRALAEDEGPFDAEFGLAASPCQSDSTLFILLEHDAPDALVAIDKASGATIWKADRKAQRSWSSPAMVEINGAVQLVISSAGSIDGYDPATGQQLWTYTDIGGNTGTTPIDCGDGRFLVGASPGRNGENAGSAADSNALIKVSQEGDQWNVEKKWIAEGAVPSWASPIMFKGFAYWINRAGVVYCFDATTGQEVYAKRIDQPSWATPIASGDRIYFFGQQGRVTVLAAGPEFKVLAENESWNDDSLPAEPMLAEEKSEERRRAAAMFSKPTLYGVALGGDALLLRVGNCLICIRD
ncbi:PQQ-like beta-propeller repeat protein [Stieleria sp. TO1_6]|uniref:outer membrane protein assembly factor BamB family protein n=1 Tax=Stieleria tagensis TaxID=2956795 RepID=UPI00209B3C57|nr:PQQ-binding-like beta-propeller repeat protein [Stieleria tagensis]MCO8121932.1 PQQ-like beta-propeller repeat protein [Stieleria tagensis]